MIRCHNSEWREEECAEDSFPSFARRKCRKGAMEPEAAATDFSSYICAGVGKPGAGDHQDCVGGWQQTGYKDCSNDN